MQRLIRKLQNSTQALRSRLPSEGKSLAAIDCLRLKTSRKFSAGKLLLAASVVLLPVNQAIGVAYTYLGNAVAPQQLNSSTSDTLTVNNLFTIAASLIGGTVFVNMTNANPVTITVANGGTIDSTATNPTSVFINGAGTGITTINVNTGGAITSTSTNAIISTTTTAVTPINITLAGTGSINKGVVLATGNTGSLIFNGTGSITGNVQLGSNYTLALNGGGTSGKVVGNITGGGSNSTLLVASQSISADTVGDATTSVTLGGTVSNVGSIIVGQFVGHNTSANLTTGGAISGVDNQLQVLRNTSSLTLLHVLSGTGFLNSDGIINVNVVNGLSLSGILTNLDGGGGTGINFNETSALTSTINNFGHITIATGKTLANAGTFTYKSVNADITGAGTYSNSGTINFDAITPSASALGFTGNFTHSGTLNVTQNLTRANVTNSTGAIAIGSGKTFTNTGTFTQTSGAVTGSSGTLLNNGTYSFASGTLSCLFNNAGTLNIAAPLTPASGFISSGTLNIDTNGVFTPPATYTITGTTSLNGVTAGTGGKIVGNYVTGAASTFIVNGVGNLTGALTMGAGSNILFTNGATGGGTITGAITTTTSTLTVGTVSVAGAFTPSAAITGLNNLVATNGVFTSNFGTIAVASTISTGALGTITLTKTLNGAAAVTNAGIFNVNAENALAATGALSNSGTFNVNSTYTPTSSSFDNTGTGILNIKDGGVFTKPTTFTNTGTTTLTGTGSINGAYLGGVNAIININGTGSITGALTLGAPSAVNFNNGATGGGTIGGALTGSTTTLTIGPVSVGNYTPQGAVSGIANLVVTNGTFTNTLHPFTVLTAISTAAAGTITLNNILTGAATVTNAGTLNIDFINALTATGALSNTGSLNLTKAYTPTSSAFTTSGTININSGGIFTKPVTFTNTGITKIDGTGTINGAYIGGAGSSLIIGPTTSTTSYTTTGTITGLETITVQKGLFTVANAVSGAINFNISSGAKAVLNAVVTGTGAVTNAGTLTFNTAAALASFASLTNTGSLNIAANFTVPATLTNTGAVYIYSTSATIPTPITITGTLSGGGVGSLHIGRDNTLSTNYLATSYTTSNTITNMPTIHLYAGNFTASNAISGVTSFTIDPDNTTTSGTTPTSFNLNAQITDAGTATIPTLINAGTMSIGVNNPFVASGASKWLISNSGSLTLNNALVLSAANTNITSLTNTGTITVKAALTTDATNPNKLINNGTLIVDTGGSVTGNINGSINSRLRLITPAGIAPIGNVTGNVTGGAFSQIDITNTGTIIGNVTVSSGSVINFTNPSGTAPITGNITAVNSTVNVGTTGTSGLYTIPATKTFTGIANLNVINGTFDNNGIAVTISTAVTTGTSGILTLSGAFGLTGSGTFTNAGTLNVNTVANFNVTGFTTSATNSGTINVAAGRTLTVGSNFTNTGLINLVGAASSLSGNLIGGAGSSLVIGSTGADNFTTNGTITNIKTITVANGSLTVPLTKNITGVDTAFNVTGGDAIFNAPVSGAGSFTISSGRTLTLNSSAVVSGFSSIGNGGAIVVNGTANVLPAITGGVGSSLTTGADGSTNVFSTNNTIDNVQTITVGSVVNYTFTVNNFVTNVNTAFTVNAGSTANINAIMSGTGVVTNNGTLNTTSTINMGSYTTAVAGAKLRILSSNGAGYGGLVCSGTADFSLGKIQIVEDTFPLETPYSWTVIQSSGAFTPPVALDDIDLPANSFLSRWTKTINSNSLIITHVRHELTTSNKPLEAVLQQMYSNPANAALTNLINILTSVSVGFNDAIQKLLPSTNSIAPSIAVNNQAINKIEMRVAAMRDGLKSPSAIGISAGELAPDTSVWISNFGSITNQQRNGDMDGYKAKSLGVLLGFDTKTYRKNFIGFAFGSSGSNVRSHLNESSTTKIHRYHALAYGSRNLGDNNHLDWLVTGSYNKNNGSKPIIINGNDLSTIFNFASRQGSVKIVRGKSFDFWESYRFTPLTSIQYSYANQDAYQETGSIAATRFSKMSKNVVTVGAGARFDFPVDSWSLIGMREFRAVVNYDVLNTKNRMIASFVAGSSNFMVTDDPARFAVKLGAGMTFELADKLQLQFNYDYEIRRSFTDHTGMLKLRYLF